MVRGLCFAGNCPKPCLCHPAPVSQVEGAAAAAWREIAMREIAMRGAEERELRRAYMQRFRL